MTYAELIADLQTWMENTATTFTDSLDTIIDMAERRISKELNCDAMREQATLTLVNGTATAAKPATAVAINWVRVGNTPPLEFRTLSFLLDYAPNAATTGTPRYYGNQDESTLYFAPTPNAAAAALTCRCEFDARITGLSAGTTTTWVSLNQPDLLFYACLLESGAFEKAGDDEQRYSALYDRALKSAQAEVARTRSDATSLMR